MSKKKKKHFAPVSSTKTKPLNSALTETKAPLASKNEQITEDSATNKTKTTEKVAKNSENNETNVVMKDIKKISFLLIFFIALILSVFYLDKKINLVQKIIDAVIQIYN